MFDIPTVFTDVAKGESAAYDFLAALYLWIHKQDDLIDRDKPVAPEITVGHDLNVIWEVSRNPFFQKHKDFLWPLFVLSGISYIASEDFKTRPDVLDRITAQVLKSEYMNILFGVAYCVGGYDHAVAMSRKYRSYCFDVEQPIQGQ